MFIRSGLFAKVSKKADKLKHHVVTQGMWLEKVRGGKWLKSKGKRRKKLYLQYTGIFQSSGSIMVLTVLVTGWVVLQWMQHHPSKVEQVWAEHLGSNNSWTSGGPPECWHMPLALPSAVVVWCCVLCASRIYLDPQRWLITSLPSPATSQKFTSTEFGAVRLNVNFPSDLFLSKVLEALDLKLFLSLA